MSVRANTECGRDMEGQILTNCVFGCLEAIRIDLQLYRAMFIYCARFECQKVRESGLTTDY